MIERFFFFSSPVIQCVTAPAVNVCTASVCGLGLTTRTMALKSALKETMKYFINKSFKSHTQPHFSGGTHKYLGFRW